MTREQVQEVLRMPPGNYATGEVLPYSSSAGDYGAVEWISDEGKIRVWFDQFDKSQKTQFRTVSMLRRSWLDRSFDRIRVWLGL